MSLDKYTRLKIAANVLGKTMKDLADEAGVTHQTIKGVCDGRITSARTGDFIDSKIAEAEKIYSMHQEQKKIKTA